MTTAAARITALIAFLLFALLLPAGAQTVEPIKVYIDEERLFFHEDPVIVNGTTLVQFRRVFERFGLNVTWDEANQSVQGMKGDYKLNLALGKREAFINGEKIELSVPPQLIDGHTFVPLRFVSEATGRAVSWTAESRIVHIFSTPGSYLLDAIYSGNTQMDEKGLLYYNDTLLYDGDLLDGKPSGKGVIYGPDGNVMYRGQLKNSLPHGEGTWYTPVISGIPNGELGKYSGQFHNGVISGTGYLYTPDDHLIYEGEFAAGGMYGKGNLYPYTIEMGLYYEGTFSGLSFQGMGKIYMGDKLYYEGELDSNNPSRIVKGKYYSFTTGKLEYEGELKNDRPHGTGNFYLPTGDGRKYEGQFNNGVIHGSGKLYDAEGKLLYEGMFEFGRPVDPNIAMSDLEETTIRLNNELVAKHSQQWGLPLEDRCYAFDGEYVMVVNPCDMYKSDLFVRDSANYEINIWSGPGMPYPEIADDPREARDKVYKTQTITVYDKAGSITDTVDMHQVINKVNMDPNHLILINEISAVNPGYYGYEYIDTSALQFIIWDTSTSEGHFQAKVNAHGKLTFNEIDYKTYELGKRKPQKGAE